MQRRNLVLWAAAGGAVIGALATRLADPHRLAAFFSIATDRELMNYRGFLFAAVAGWALFGFYWDLAAKNAAAATKSESRHSRAIHVFLANAALLLEIAPVRGLGRLLPVSAFIMSAGLAVEAIGLLIAIWARRHLGRNWSGEISIKEEHELIRSGPYGLLRHPIYTGLLAMYLGVALVTGERLAAIGFALAVFAYWRKIRLEEANLETAFGSDYAAYRRATWSVIPGVY